MKPTVQIAETMTPEGVRLALCEHDATFFLTADGAQLRTSFAHAAEEHLARLACAPFRPAAQPRILIGGLGLGYTLAEACRALPQARARFTVAEPVPALEAWNRQHLAHLHPGLWDDPRITVLNQESGAVMASSADAFHAILLDTDHGRDAFSGQGLNSPYAAAGLDLAHAALKDGGLLGVWSATPHPGFEKRLRHAGFEVATESVPAAHKGKQRRQHLVWLARKGTYQSQHQKRRR